MSRPLIRSGQWSQTTTGITQPADRPIITDRSTKPIAFALIQQSAGRWESRDYCCVVVNATVDQLAKKFQIRNYCQVDLGRDIINGL